MTDDDDDTKRDALYLPDVKAEAKELRAHLLDEYGSDATIHRVGASELSHELGYDDDLSAELAGAQFGLCRGPVGGKSLALVVGYLDYMDDATSITTGLSLHDAGVRRCIDAEWSLRAMSVGDDVSPGVVRLIGKDERARTGTTALWRVSISLPWWVLAEPTERTRGLRHLLLQCGWTGERGPHVRKPDVVQFSDNLRRNGLPMHDGSAAVLVALSDMWRSHYANGPQGSLFAPVAP